MSEFLNKKLSDYIKNNSFDRKVESNWEALDKFQLSLISTSNEYLNKDVSQTDLDKITVSPLNNMAFAAMLNDDTLNRAAYYLLTSLSSSNNQFLFDKNKLIKLFKSNTGVTDLPYSFVLYLGALHYANRHWLSKDMVPKTTNNVQVVTDIDYYATPNILDGNKNKDFDISNNGQYAPNYGYEVTEKYEQYTIGSQTFIGETFPANAILPSIRIYNDSSYRKGYKSSFIPKFGYGTYSSFMDNHYQFMINGSSNYVNDQKPFHIYGAEQGFVKSFKTYKSTDNIDINFMGHYTILKNKYGFTIPEKIELIKEYESIVNNISDFTLTNLTLNPIDNKVLRQIYKLYCKIKIAYTTDQISYNTKQSILQLVTDLNSKKQVTVNYGINMTMGLFSYLVYYYFYNSTPNNRIKQLNDIIKLFNIKISPDSFNNDDKLLTNFLLSFWDKEKEYGDNISQSFDKDGNVTSSFLVLLYPSAGGDFNPEKLLRSSNEKDILVKLSKTNWANLSSFSEFKIQTNLQKKVNLVSHKNQLTPKLESGKSFVDIFMNDKTFDSLKSANNNEPAYIISKSSSSLTKLHFSNKTLIESATRFLWYDTAYDGLNLYCRDKIQTDLTADAVKNEELVDTNLHQCLYVKDDNKNFFKNVYKTEVGKLDLKTKNSVTKQELYEIIDIQKFDSFEQIFIDFAKKGDQTVNNNQNYTMRNILKGISTVDESNFTTELISLLGKDYDDIKSVEDLLLFIAGYSSYNYYFCSEYNISALINASLTLGQYNRVEASGGVLDEFMKQKMSVNNYSTIGSVSVLNQSDLYTQYHRYVFRPDVILNGGTLSASGADEQKISAYYIKKFIFGDVTVNPFNGVEDSVLFNYIRGYVNIDRTYKIIFKYTQEDAALIIRFLFKYLDIEFNYPNFAILHPYINNLLNGMNVANGLTTPDGEIVSFLVETVNAFYKNNVNAMNAFLINLKDTFKNKYLNPQNKDSLFVNKKNVDTILDAKTKTYYNIKNIYDKYLSYQRNDITPLSNKYQGVDLSQSLGEFSNTQGMLFYNFLYKDLSLDNTNSHVLGEVSKFSTNTPKHLCEYVQIVDRANNDIGDRILIDIVSLSDKIKLDFGGDNTDFLNKTVYGIFDILASDNGFILHPINSFVDRLSINKGNQSEHANALFGQHTTTDRVDSNPAFILQWMDQSSSVDQKKNNLSQKVLTNSFTLDISYDGKNVVNAGDIPEDLLRGQVTSFVVDFTNKNQNMFKNIQLNTSEFANTEESINAVVGLAAKNGEQSNKIVSGNLFRMMEQRSYTCQVESMGNMMIQPLTYFYLKNVPLFRGSYWITNVDHKLTPNNMVTTFKGVRQPFVSKVTNEKEVLTQIQETLSKIQSNSPTTPTSNLTKGVITQNRDLGTYGTYYQSTVDGYNTIDFSGQQILASLIYSEFGDKTEVYKLFISLLYNRAKYYSNNNIKSTKPSDIVKYMVDVALQLKTNYAGSELKSYMDKYNNSLYELTNNYRVEQTDPIFVLLNAIASAKSSDEVYTLLEPKNIESQLLKVTTTTNNNINSNANKYVFTTETKDSPKVSYTDISKNTTFDKSWTAYNIIYMKNIDTTTEQKNSIYVTDVNNEQFKQFDCLNPYAINDLTVNYSPSDTVEKTTYLGCFDKSKGVTFFGRIFDGTRDNYLIDKVNNDIRLFNKVNKNSVRIVTTKITDPEMRKNRLKIKNLLKDKGLTQQQVAAILGNIQKESGFNPTAVNNEEKNGSGDYGLVQFNTEYYSNGKKTIQGVIETVGSTVESQIAYLLNIGVIKEFKKNTANMTDAYDVAMIFAKRFEVCTNCFEDNKATKFLWSITPGDRKTFTSDKHFCPYERGEFARKYFTQLNDPNDELYWNSNNTQINNNSSILAIGDSLSIVVNQQNGNIDIIKSPIELSKAGWHIAELINNLTSIPDVKNYKAVVLSIGVNDGWEMSGNITTLINLMKQKFGNTKFYILNGHYGWGSVSVTKDKTAENWKNKINVYINSFRSSGFTVLGNITEVKEHPKANDAFFNTFKNDLGQL